MGRTIARRLLYLVLGLLGVLVIAFGLLQAHPGGLFFREKDAEVSAKEIVSDLIAAKLGAMQAKDIESYLALIDETDEEYYMEQRNWFLIYQDAVTSDFSIEVRKAKKVDDTTIVATLYQHYLYGPQKEDRTVKYEARFVETPGGWKDADLNFSVMDTPHFVIKYPQEAEKKALEVSEAAEIAYASVIKELGFEASGKTTVKLYTDRKMLRESSDIRVAFLFSGWAEAGEAIKMYAYREGRAEPLIAHELVHKITLEITDSQTAWFAEGLAVYFGNRPFTGGNPVQLGRSTAEELSRPISWLDENVLTLLTDEKTIALYYDMSAMIVEFMAETYGLDKLQAVLIELSKYPRYDRGYDFAMEPELQQRLYQAIETVLGVNRDAFNQGWLAWISSQ
jgi:hypothetical protein